MCGIVAMVVKAHNGLAKRTEDSFYQLLYANTLRGEDSTGVIGVDNDSSFHIAKEATEATWFINQYRDSKAAKDMWQTGKAFIGHNRKKTIGEIKDESAHPFVVNDEFAMVHNGTLFGHKTSLADTEVDSEALAIHLHKAFTDGTIETLNEALGKVNGAYATISYDQRTHKVHVLRNKERPMSFIETADAWYFASEAPMLFWILARNGYGNKDLEVKNLPENQLFSINLDDNTVETKEVLPKKPFPPVPTAVVTGVTSTRVTTKKTLDAKGGMTRQQFKRFRDAHMGRPMEFWAEDFVEDNFPKTISDGETAVLFMGAADSILCDHIIHAHVDIKDMNMSIEACLDRLWTGKVIAMNFNKRSKRITLQLDGAVPLPLSASSTKEGVHIEYHGTVCKAVTYENGIIVKERVINEPTSVSALH